MKLNGFHWHKNIRLCAALMSAALLLPAEAQSSRKSSKRPAAEQEGESFDDEEEQKPRPPPFVVMRPAPSEIWGRNLPVGLQLGWNQRLNNEADLLTGLRMNQNTNAISTELQTFLPALEDFRWTNSFGLTVRVDSDVPTQVIGKDSLEGETQKLDWSAWNLHVMPAFHIYRRRGSLSRLWLQPWGYYYRNAKLKVSSGSSLGSSTLALKRKGNVSIVGSEFSFFPYMYTGGELVWGWGQSYESNDSEFGVKRTGKWDFVEPRLLLSFRYPAKRRILSLFSLTAGFGLRFEQFQSKSPEEIFPGQKSSHQFEIKLGWQFDPKPLNAGAR